MILSLMETRSRAVGAWVVLATALSPLVVWSSCKGDPPPALYRFLEHADTARIEREGLVFEPTALTTEVHTFDDETERALTTSFPSRVTFDVQIPDHAVLRFAAGASSKDRPTILAPIALAVDVETSEGTERVYARTIRRAHGNQWFLEEIDLARLAGRRVSLTFTSERVVEMRPRAEAHIFPVWGNPTLVDRTSSPSEPDIFLISIDCLRADHLGAYGYSRDTSPHIDAFARDAFVFETAIAASSYTLPTHASMLTGRPPSLHGANVHKGIARSVPYAPATLSRAGFRTSGVVNAAFVSQTYGFHRGFDSYELVGGRASKLVDRALEVLDRGQGQCQFVFLHIFDAHAPYLPPSEFIGRFGERPPDVSDLIDRMAARRLDGPEERQQIIDLYDAEIAFVDRELGRFFDELEARELYDSSLIILTADHGEAFLEHGAWTHGGPVNRNTTGLYDEVLRVPLIVKWPGETSVGGRVDDVVSQMDVSATLLELAGIETSSPWSIELSRYVAGAVKPENRSVISEAVVEHPAGGAAMQVAFRNARFKYIATFRSGGLTEIYESAPTAEELYDLKQDPRETVDLSTSDVVDLDRFRRALGRHLEIARTEAPTDTVEVVLDEELREELRALGYLER